MVDAAVPLRGKPVAIRRLTVRGFLQAFLSLQSKATILVVALTLLVTAGASGYLLRSSAGLLRQQRSEELVHLAGLLARSAAPLVAEADAAALRRLAEDVTASDTLAYVSISSPDGRILARARGEAIGEDPVQPARADLSSQVPGLPVYRAASAVSPALIDVVYPVSVAAAGDSASSSPAPTQLVGYVRVGIVANGWHRTLNNRLDMLIGVGIIALGAAVPLGFLLVRRIISPLEGLEQAMVRFSAGQLNVRSPVNRRDEVGRLAAAFNRMADEHQQAHEGIIKSKAELEARVAQRTRQLRELAVREPLTGLYNRRHFNEVLERSFSEAVRYDNDMSCIMIDLDDFKGVNDVFGHDIGDQVLVVAATTMRSQLRTADVAARFGGDEFVVLLPQTDAERARTLGERIVKSFVTAVLQRLPQVLVTMSVGIASLRSTQAKDAAVLLRAADRALYEAKTNGKNGVVTAAQLDFPAPR